MRKVLIIFIAVFFFALSNSVVFAQEGTIQNFYHLLIVDRTNSPPDSDIGDVANATMLYNYTHDRNGYFVALYVSPQQDPLSLQLPDGSYVVANMTAAQRIAVREYVNSSAFRRFVTNRTVISQLQRVLLVEPGLPVSTAALPLSALREIAYRSVQVGATRSLADITSDRGVVSWSSSTPSTVSVDSEGNITGLQIGNGYISINETEYISIAVIPVESFYLVPVSQEALLPPGSRSSSSTANLTEYRTEPTFRLAYRFRNRGEARGASGSNGGIDVLGRGANYEWLWTTYFQGGWFYDLNGVKREMVNGYQRDANNGVELTIKPEFVYNEGIPYLQLRHVLHNPGNTAVTGQKFGASADVMIHQNDYAPLVLTDYGAYMTDSQENPSLELMFVCTSGDGIDPVDALWLGDYSGGNHVEYIYVDRRSSVSGVDSAIGFSYQGIDLAPGETREFLVRFTLARTED